MRISAAPTASGPRRGTHGGATVPLIEVGARGERHTMFLQQRLAPRLRVGVRAELSTDARVHIEGAIGRCDAGPAKIIEGAAQSRGHRRRLRRQRVGLAVGLLGEGRDRRVLGWYRWAQRELPASASKGVTRSAGTKLL